MSDDNPVVYLTTQPLPGGNGQLGSPGGVSRSNTTRLSETFPQGASKFQEEELSDVRDFYYGIYSYNLDPASRATALAEAGAEGIGEEAGMETQGFSPSFGYYRLNYFGAPVPSEVPVGAQGLPGTPFLPNIVSAPMALWDLMPSPPERLSFMQRQTYGIGSAANSQASSPNVSSGQQSVNRSWSNPVRLMGKSPYTGQGALRNNPAPQPGD